MERIYLDYAATTPVDPQVFAAMTPYFSQKFGNPGSLHSFGQEAIAAVDHSREIIAKAIGADFREIIFTSSATEANNLAIRGIAIASRSQGIAQPKIIISAIEHESVLETARGLEQWGIEVFYLPVNKEGIVDLQKFEAALDERTVLVSIMYANNEIGTIQPIAKIAEMIRIFRSSHKGSVFPFLHTDAVQAFPFLDCNVQTLGVDLMTLSAHKIYGPKGIGALYVRQGSSLAPIITGGGQEFGLRSGTENVPLIIGFAKAVELAVAARAGEVKRVEELKSYFWEQLHIIFPKAEVNGSEKGGIQSILNVYFPDALAEELLTRFDIAGLAVSSGSACRARSLQSSHVIEALGFPERAKRSIRFSFGRPTTKHELDAALNIISMNIAR